MIKKSIFEDEIISGMQIKLAKKDVEQEISSITTAIDYLNSAAEIFEDMGLVKSSDQIIDILYKVAKLQDLRKINDFHTKNLTPEKMVKNLLHHGTQFNMADDQKSEDLLNSVVDDNIDVIEDEDKFQSFEDEKD